MSLKSQFSSWTVVNDSPGEYGVNYAMANSRSFSAFCSVLCSIMRGGGVYFLINKMKLNYM